MSKKKMLIITAISSVIIIPIIIITIIVTNHIQNSENYAAKSKWNCNDETFINEYISYYENEIDNLLLNMEVDMTKNIKENYSYSHSIIYNTDNVYLRFTFINNKKYAKCLIDCYFYGLSCDELLQNENIDIIIDIIEKFGRENIFDYHKGYDNILDTLNDNLSINGTKSFKSYEYHYDSLVGNLGYYYELNSIGDSSTNYFDPIEYENRACFQMNFTSILIGIL